jgi:vacuolar-type H+-ATPase subunit B/Vma2
VSKSLAERMGIDVTRCELCDEPALIGTPLAEAGPWISHLIEVIKRQAASILSRQDGVKVRGVCDSNPEAGRRTAEKFMLLRSYTDPEEMLIKEKPQVVHIVTPPQSHAALTDLATKHGCHVLVEKPMAVNAAEARRMVALAKERVPEVVPTVRESTLIQRYPQRARAAWVLEHVECAAVNAND